MSTKRYLQNGKWPGLETKKPNIPKVKLAQVEGNLEIDVDIEKKIAQLQEARIAGEIEKPKQLSIDPEKQISEWHLEKGLKTFLNNVEFEKEDLDKKIKEEDAKISALEELFGGLADKPKTKKEIEIENTEVISETSFNEISEEDKKEREHARLKALAVLFEKNIVKEKKEKEEDRLKRLEEERKEKLLIDSGLEKPKVTLDKETIKEHKLARKNVEEKYGQAGALAVEGLLKASHKEIEEDPEIVDKVLNHISEMKVANELDKDKMKSLKSIDTLEKLTKEFLNFKNLTSIQLSTVGGGLDPNKISADLLPTTSGTYDLGSSARPWRKLYLTSGSLIVGSSELTGTELGLLDGITAGTVAASKAVVVDSNKDVSGFRNVVIAGDLTVQGTTTTVESTTVNIQNAFVFEGATDDAHETTLTTIEPTADRTIKLPNVSGTIPVLAAESSTAITATPTELNYCDGVTGNIQTAIDAKATKAFAIAQAVALG
tara:strand:- start:503 stop:1969 length:1467 start_codon:yes stop_codon:yes gene_type:complete